MRDDISRKPKYKGLDNEQELFLRFLAFKATSGELKSGYFKKICNRTTRTNQVGTAMPFGAPRSAERRSAQDLLAAYIKRLNRLDPNLTRPPTDYSPYTAFLSPDSAEAVNSLSSSPKLLHTSPKNCFTPIIRNKTMSKTPPFKNNNTEQTHDVWSLLTQEHIMDSIPLFHCDPTREDEVGYGPEHNHPGVHCLIQDATDSTTGAVHRQMSVFYKTTITDSLLIKGRLTPSGNGINIQIPVVSPLAFSHTDKMNQVSASQSFVPVVLFSSLTIVIVVIIVVVIGDFATVWSKHKQRHRLFYDGEQPKKQS